MRCHQGEARLENLPAMESSCRSNEGLAWIMEILEDGGLALQRGRMRGNKAKTYLMQLFRPTIERLNQAFQQILAIFFNCWGGAEELPSGPVYPDLAATPILQFEHRRHKIVAMCYVHATLSNNA